jgi:hypothetical protein
MDRTTAAVLLARESGHVPTSVACYRLNVSKGELLRLRRRLIERALGVAKLPPVATKTPLPMVEAGDER